MSYTASSYLQADLIEMAVVSAHYKLCVAQCHDASEGVAALKIVNQLGLP
jgi:hypothetical protein